MRWSLAVVLISFGCAHVSGNVNQETAGSQRTLEVQELKTNIGAAKHEQAASPSVRELERVDELELTESDIDAAEPYWVDEPNWPEDYEAPEYTPSNTWHPPEDLDGIAAEEDEADGVFYYDFA